MPNRVFVSYARGDDEPFVYRLCADLKAQGFTVWFDRESLMSRGLTFHQEIKDAIRCEVDRIVYVSGPEAAASRYVREEWQLGLEFDHIVVTPIVRLGEHTLTPGELGLLHCEDFRDDSKYSTALAKLVTSLREPNPKLGALFAVPSLPPHFLARPELMCRMRDTLLVDLQTAHVITCADARVGIQGMAGIGKSVLAAALARNREVRQSYPDGIVWLSFGRHLTRDDLLSRLRDLVAHLGGDTTFSSLPQGHGVLRELFQKKAVLLVLDDVWRAGDAKEFDHLGPRCRMLITTQDKGILDTLHGELVPISLFTETEALQLLADAVGLGVSTLPAEAREVADECGLLPLALALSGGMAQKRGGDFHCVLERLRRADLEKIADRESINEAHRSIWRAMQASVEMLGEQEQRRFAELAVFPEDDTVPGAAVATLWAHTGDLDELDTEELLINLGERSLIQLDQKPGADGKIQRRISLHDLLHDYATRISARKGEFVFRSPSVSAGPSSNGGRDAADPSHPLAHLHQTLLDAYQKKCPNGWASGPDDGWFLQHLRDHLCAAAQGAELVCLLLELPWLQRKVEGGLTFDLPVDFQTALTHATDHLGGKRLLSLTGEIIRRNAHFIAQNAVSYPQGMIQCFWNATTPSTHSLAVDHTSIRHDGWVQFMRKLTDSMTHLVYGRTAPEKLTDAAHLRSWLIVQLSRLPSQLTSRHWIRAITSSVAPLGRGIIMQLTGQVSPVRTIQYRARDGVLFSSGDDKGVFAWSAVDGTKLGYGISEGCSGFGFLTGVDECFLTISHLNLAAQWQWNGRNVEVVREYRLPAEVGAACFDRVSHQLVIAGRDGSVYFVEGTTGNVIRVIEVDPDRVTTHPSGYYGQHSLALTCDGRYLAAASLQILTVIDLTRHVIVQTLQHGDSEHVERLSFTPDGSLLLAALQDGRLVIWDATSWSPKKTIGEPYQLHSGKNLFVRSTDPLEDSASNWLAIWGGEGGALNLFHSVKGLGNLVRTGHAFDITALDAMGADRIATGARDGAILVHELEAWLHLAEWSPKRVVRMTATTVAAAFSSCGSFFATLNNDDSLRVFDIAREEPALVGPPEKSRGRDLRSIEKFFWCHSASEMILIQGVTATKWRIPSWSPMGDLLLPKQWWNARSRVTWNEQSMRFAATTGGWLAVWQWAGARPERILLNQHPLGNEDMNVDFDVRFSGDGQVVGVCSTSGRVWVVDVVAGTLLTEHLPSNESGCPVFTFDFHGSRLARREGLHGVRVWDIRCGKMLAHIESSRYLSSIDGFAFDQHGFLIVKQSERITKWDAVSSAQVGKATGNIDRYSWKGFAHTKGAICASDFVESRFYYSEEHFWAMRHCAALAETFEMVVAHPTLDLWAGLTEGHIQLFRMQEGFARVTGNRSTLE